MFIRLLTSTANASNQLMLLPLNNQQCMTRLILINLYRSEYTLKDYVTIYLLLIQIDVSEFVILLIIYLIEYVFQTKRKI